MRKWRSWRWWWKSCLIALEPWQIARASLVRKVLAADESLFFFFPWSPPRVHLRVRPPAPALFTDIYPRYICFFCPEENYILTCFIFFLFFWRYKHIPEGVLTISYPISVAEILRERSFVRRVVFDGLLDIDDDHVVYRCFIGIQSIWFQIDRKRQPVARYHSFLVLLNQRQLIHQWSYFLEIMI